jgi:hypothetical protein
MTQFWSWQPVKAQESNEKRSCGDEKQVDYGSMLGLYIYMYMYICICM